MFGFILCLLGYHDWDEKIVKLASDAIFTRELEDGEIEEIPMKATKEDFKARHCLRCGMLNREDMTKIVKSIVKDLKLKDDA